MIGDEIIQPDEILEEDANVTTQKVYVRTYATNNDQDFYPERPVTKDTRVLVFDIPSLPEHIFRPSECTFHIRKQIVKTDANETAHRTAAEIAGDTADQPSVRFKNTAFMGDIVNKVQVIPNMMTDIQEMDDKLQCLQEKFNVIYLMGKEEREARTLWLNRSFSAKLHRGAYNDRVGFAADIADDTEEITLIRTMETQARDFRTYIMKLPGPFFYIPSEIPEA